MVTTILAAIAECNSLRYWELIYRTSELHAAVGLAQMRKIQQIRDANRENKSLIKNILSKINELSFRNMPDSEGDSATFLNFFLPDTETAQRVMHQFAKDGIVGCNYWYTNMYHFINQWEHIKDIKSPMKLAIHEIGAPQDYHKLELPHAQNIIGRLISLGIKANWTIDQANELGNMMKKSILKVLEK